MKMWLEATVRNEGGMMGPWVDVELVGDLGKTAEPIRRAVFSAALNDGHHLVRAGKTDLLAFALVAGALEKALREDL